MAAKELKWVDAAIKVLNESPGVVWMTAPELVREIQRREIRTIKNNYGQAVRTLRAALNGISKKPCSTFCRSDGDFNVSFALRKRLNSIPGSCKPPSRPPPRSHKRKAVLSPPLPPSPGENQQLWVPITNGLYPLSPPPSRHVPLATPTVPPNPLTSPTYSATSSNTIQSPYAGTNLGSTKTVVVEIDEPSTRIGRPGRLNIESDINSWHMCLPSPLTSILGPRKTLQVLSESSVPQSLRPVRQVRKRLLSKDGGEDLPHSPPMTSCAVEAVMSSPPPPPPPPPVSSPPEVLQVETCHVLLSHLFDVVCVRPPHVAVSSSNPIGFEDPCYAQGNRSHTGSFELSKKKAADSAAESPPFSSDSESESELSDPQIQLHPSSRLMMSRRLSQQRQYIDYGQLSEDMTEESEDVDVEYVDTMVCYSRGRDSSSTKRGNRSRGNTEEGRKVEQKNISSLFQSQSPLISENMKSLLNMDDFMSLTETQRRQLVNLLPAVDRTGPSTIARDSLGNSFFSSALREWQEQVALGAFTAEYRARIRAEEKRRSLLKADDSWKRSFFEDRWGDSGATPPDSTPKLPDSTPFYPHYNLSPTSQACLQAIRDDYYGKDKETQPAHSQATHPSVSTTLPTLPPPNPSPTAVATHSATATPTSSQSNPRRPTTSQAKKSAQSLKTNAATKKVTRTSPVVPSQKKNHVARKVSSKFSLPSLLNKSSRVSKAGSKKTSTLFPTTRNSVDKLKASKVIEQLKLNSQRGKSATCPGQFLTLLPPRTPYQCLLMALTQACKGNKPPSKDHPPPPFPPPPPPPPVLPPSSPLEQQHISTSKHTHSVFHDHFALLNADHVPSEFCSPVTSLSLQLPIDIYTACVRARVAREEHSYAKAPEMLSPRDIRKNQEMNSQLNLKLSLPRSLLQSSETMSPCGCDRGALVFCSCCRSLYHSNCSSGTLCSNCFTLKSLNLSEHHQD